MNTKRKYVITFLVNAIILLGICWPKSDQIYAETDKVKVETNKTTYAIGEPIKATLVFEGIIYQWDRYAWSIQKWEGGSWILIQRRGDPYFFCANMTECKNIDLSTVKECDLVLCESSCWYKVIGVPKLEWDQSYKTEENDFQCALVQRNPRDRNIILSRELRSQTCAVFKQVSSGRYKIRFEYATVPVEFYDKKDVEMQYAEKVISIK